MKIRQARTDDIPSIVRLRRDASQWLGAIGSDQWAKAGIGIDTDEFVRRVRSSISAGETWVAEDCGSVVATIAIDTHTNPGLWYEAELFNSLVIHRMIRGRQAPRGTGELLLDHADKVARDAGVASLKLDAWTSNHALHQYYLSQGFRHVRTVDNHHTASAALFERPVPLADTPNVTGAQAGEEMRKTSEHD